MPNILLMCPEPLGHRQPAGVGIRFIEFARALNAAGHQVTVLSPDGGAVENCLCEVADRESIHAHTAKNDAAVVQGHIANDLFAYGKPIPTIVDLYDPYLIENLHYSRTHGEEVFIHDHATLMRSLQRGDFFLCASEAQRFFYLGLLLATSRLNPDSFERDATLSSLLAIVPFGVQAPRQVPVKNLGEPAAFFGGIYDWYEPTLAIEAVRLARERFPRLTITFAGHPNAHLTPQSVAAETRRYAEKQKYDFVRFEEWVPYAERATYYDRFTFSLLTFGRSIETDLAMRTRIFDSLWAGLPVITSSARGTDEILEKYHAGIVIDDSSPRRYADAIVSLLSDEARYRQLVRGGADFTSDHQWSNLLEPLLDFCRTPRIDASKPDVSLETPAVRPSSIFARLRRKIGA